MPILNKYISTICVKVEILTKMCYNYVNYIYFSASEIAFVSAP